MHVSAGHAGNLALQEGPAGADVPLVHDDEGLTKRPGASRFARIVTSVALGALLLATAVEVGPASSAGAAARVSAGSVQQLTGVPSDNFWLATPQGGVEDYGSAPSLGSAGNLVLAQPITSITPTNDNNGYWLLGGDGGIFSFGDARFFGSTGNLRLNQPIVGMAPTPDGQGYWLVASDGGIFSFGDARFFGSTGNLVLNQPIVGMAPTPDGQGYWLVASDGGVFSFGDAHFFGSTGGIALVQPIVGMAATRDGGGYWMVAADGGIFNFGDAGFYGSAAGNPTSEPVQKVVPSRSGHGYWIEEQNGTAFGEGDVAGATPPVESLLLKPITPGDKAVLFAFLQLGKPYIWGGNGPVGYDCSGLALASWEHGAGIGFARVANDQYVSAGVPIPYAALSAGDLVFWGSSMTDWTSVYHTGIYVGGNDIVEATGDHVQLNTLGQWGLGDLMPNARRP
jgi:hypothetical protein